MQPWKGSLLQLGPGGALHLPGRSHQHSPSPEPQQSQLASKHPNGFSSAPGVDHLSQHLTWVAMGWTHAAPSALSPARVAGDGSRQPDQERLSPFLGCSDNELIRSLFQSHGKRDLLYQGLDVFFP